ncbi:MAG: formylglycine-generating enzyme family protein [Armatimonadetes bacterium]|nr:formylglycine-generating enzyme family protein [Armatimonadota bacterium]
MRSLIQKAGFVAQVALLGIFVIGNLLGCAKTSSDNKGVTPHQTAKTEKPTVITKKNPKDGAEMVLIPAGKFLMGDDDIEDNPRHTVELSAYYIYKDVVTVGQYEAYCKATGAKMPFAPNFDANWSKKDHPIVNVTWAEARTYAKWAGGDLPSEAQWERAARGTDGRKYPWGDEFDKSKVWDYLSESVGTGPVGVRGITQEGLSDMSGNVWQWCLDGYDKDYWGGNSSHVVNPVNVTVRMERVLRGGSWSDNNPDSFRCAAWGWIGPGSGSYAGGFRVVFRGLP